MCFPPHSPPAVNNSDKMSRVNAIYLSCLSCLIRCSFLAIDFRSLLKWSVKDRFSSSVIPNITGLAILIIVVLSNLRENFGVSSELFCIFFVKSYSWFCLGLTSCSILWKNTAGLW